MGRYNVSIEKFLGFNPEKPITRVEVSGYILKLVERRTDQNGVDADGNMPHEYEVSSSQTDELVRLASFEVTDPVARYIKVVTIGNTQAGQFENTKSISASKTSGDEKSVQILHKRRSADRVNSCSEATSSILNTKHIEHNETETQLDNADHQSEDKLLLDPLPNGKTRTLRIDLNELQNSEKVTFRLDTARDTVNFEGGSAIKVVNLDENGNSQPIDVPLSNNNNQSSARVSGIDDNTEPCDDKTQPSNTISQNEAQSGQTVELPIQMSVTVSNDLTVFVELDNNYESCNYVPEPYAIKQVVFLGVENEAEEESVQSLVEPDTLFHLPYQHVFLDSLSHPDKTRRPLSRLTRKENPGREERKQVLRKLILHRLLDFGTPNVTAYDITDTWYSGYIQHRALSYRIPKTRFVSKQTLGDEPEAELQKPVTIKMGARILDSAGFIENFVYHANFLKGILNSATCSALECTFYVMIPHFKTRTDKNVHYLPGAGISPFFISDWLSVIFTSAYQLKPNDPEAIADLVKKEMKLVNKLLLKIKKTQKKMKERLRYVQDKAEVLKQKTYERIKLDIELANEIQRDEEPNDYAGFAHLQMVGFTGPQIFPRYLHFLTAKFGLFLKKEAEEPWFPFSDLNFLERRVIFLGLMDHFYTSFDAVLTTIRHLEEIYTPGYPMNLLTQFKRLFDLLNRPKPSQLLATESKLSLYAAACGCLGAFKRFKYVHKELVTMVKEASAGIQKFEYSVPACGEFIQKIGSTEKTNKVNVNLIVPFATLNLEAFANLSQRGTSATFEG